jgi:tRNA U38,U39,U40 pseudouridine synthase TruA
MPEVLIFTLASARLGQTAMTDSDSKGVVAFVGILVTLLLGVYNTVQNYRTSRRTTFINTVTSERVKWIDKLRETVSTFCGTAHYWRFSTVRGSQEQKQKIEEIDKLRHLIVLQLNPKGSLDREIEGLVGEIVSMTSGHIPASDDEYRQKMDRLTHATQDLLKAEWEKAKEESLKGDLSRK